MTEGMNRSKSSNMIMIGHDVSERGKESRYFSKKKKNKIQLTYDGEYSNKHQPNRKTYDLSNQKSPHPLPFECHIPSKTQFEIKNHLHQIHHSVHQIV